MAGQTRLEAHPATPLLDQLGRDLVEQARQGHLKPLYGRAKELRQLQRTLLRRTKNTPLLVGAPGVGKTALVEGFASLLAAGAALAELRPLRLVEISPALLVAGTTYRGSFEARLQALLAEARSDPGLILFIDEIHTLVRAGAVEGGALDAANMLKPVLANGELRCIGATTPDEYDRFVRSDPAFERRFQPILLEEPSETEAIDILLQALPAYAGHHGVRILPEAAEAAVHLTQRHILDRYLPDKAFDLLDDACTLARLPDPDSAMASEVNAAIVAEALAEKLNLPAGKLQQEQAARLGELEHFLKERIIGQDLSLERLAGSLQSAFSSLAAPERPRRVLAFVGSTGVGKTATAKALAEFLFEDPGALIRLDMVEYKEPSSVARLFGAPPGYVGYNDEGSFATRLRRQPYTLVLLDEIEKAHPQALDAFLQIFDEGRFRDSRGRLVEARQAVFVLTSNLFSLPDLRSAEEYGECLTSVRQSLAGFLRPEFVNRIDEIILFRDLGESDLARIADREIQEINQRLAAHQVSLQVGPGVLEWIAAEALDPLSGARAVTRLVARTIAEPVSRLLMAGRAAPGQVLQVTLQAGCLEIKALGAIAED